MTEHTPGPWYMTPARKPVPAGGSDFLIHTAGGGADNGHIAEVFQYQDRDHQDGPAEANACLIAAAPALLEALEEATQRLIGLERSIATDDLETYITERHTARALIAQARGEPTHA